MKLDNNTILITGGASGIGLALANEFLKHQNNTVIVCGRDTEKLECVSNHNPRIVTFRCDVAKDADQQQLVEFVMRKFPTLNMLINNAGIQRNYSLTDTKDHTSLVEEEVCINFMAPVTLADRLLPHLLKQREAAVINVTSALAVVPKKSAPVYCATKAALRNYTAALRYQLEDTSVKVFEIVPALVDTEMTKGRGKRTMAPEALAVEALRSIAADKYEIRIEKTKLLFALNRWLPSVARRIIKNG